MPMSSLIESRGCIDRTLNINGVGTLAQGPTDPDGCGRERMHAETVQVKYLVFIFLGALVIYLIYINYMIRMNPYYFFGI